MSLNKKHIDELVNRYNELEVCRNDMEKAFELLKDCFSKQKKVLIAGNGGSAADTEHIVGELMKGFILPRKLEREYIERLILVDAELGKELSTNLQQALPTISLVNNVALSTAYANDVNGVFGYAQQLNGYGMEDDVFWGITTSGNSKNILYALIVAKAKGLKTIVLTGNDGGEAKKFADVSIIVPEDETYKIQELHLPIYHCLCLMLEEYFFGN